MSKQPKDYLIAYKVYKPLTKGKKIAIAVVTVILALFLAGGYYFLVYQKDNFSTVDENNLTVFMDGDFYLGNQVYTDGISKSSTFNLKEALIYAADTQVTFESLSTNIATIDGEMITISSTGDLNMRITTAEGAKERSFFVVEGINVFNFEHLFYAVEQEENIVLQANIDLKDPTKDDYELEPSSGNIFDLKANFYGNGFDVVCADVLSGPYDTAFRIKESDILIRDTHFFGIRLGEDAKLEDLEQYGAIITAESDSNNAITGTLLKNCILENAHRCLFISSSEITVDGCIIRNASDSTVSVNTNNNAPSDIVIKNCVMANSVVSCITFWCMDEITNPDNFVTITFEGFFDCYNWKDTDNARIMPRTEPVEPLVKKIITSNMKKPIYQDYYYQYKQASYVHLAMMIIATPPSQGNYPEINGLDAIGYQVREFPLPAAAKSLIKTLNVCGYVDNPSISPDESLGDNPKLYQELRYGRD